MGFLPSLRSRKEPPELPRVVEVPLPARPQPAASAADDLPPFLRRGGAGSAAKPSARPEVENETSPRTAAGPAPAGRPAPETARLLKATLNEIGECRRMLDAAREREW
jgi:hypothetical protein